MRQLLSSEIVEGREERYQFTWPDKRKAILAANAPVNATLRPCREESVDFDTTQNLYIEGDNLDVLKCLKETYLHKVKMIYIDPPYNTGNDFIYEDDFAESTAEYLANSGQFDEQGNRMVTNTESNGRFHTDWLNMIYPRLKVARDLLTKDGVIFISIDDNEVENLRKVCDEVFGECNFIAQLVWEQGRKSMAAQIAINHEYCLIYAKNRIECIAYDNQVKNNNWRTLKQGLDRIYAEADRLQRLYGTDIEKIEKGLSDFYKSLPDTDPAKAHSHYRKFDPCLGIYYQGDISQGTGKGGRFDIIHPDTGKPCKVPSGGWRFSEAKLPELLKENRIAFGKDETVVPCLKRFLKETEYEVFSSVFYKDGRGASKRLDALIGKNIFEYPKDEEIIKRFIALTTSYSDADSLILDFFSGSATTAHAVMQLNAEDGGNRRFIMVQLPELTDEKSEAYKAGYKTICEIGKERIRRAGAKINEELGMRNEDLGLFAADNSSLQIPNSGIPNNSSLQIPNSGIPDNSSSLTPNSKIDVGFRVLKLDSTNMEDIYYSPEDTDQRNLFNLVDNVKPDRTGEDLLFQVMLELGAELNSSIRKEELGIKGNEELGMRNEELGEKKYTIYDVANGYIVACFDKEVTDEVVTAIAKMKPQYAVLRDTSMKNDSTATNFEQIFKRYSPNTVTKIL